MGNNVFANGREISSKACDGKSIAAFPDTCLSPPTPPAGPVPLPYPVTSQASDTAEGSTNVKHGGKEVMLKNQSNFKSTAGDEAATKSLGMGVITHALGGKVFFIAWSMDVKIEGQNAVRHLDMVTHNHMSTPGNTGPWAYANGTKSGGGEDPCEGDRKKSEKACEDYKPNGTKDACKGVQDKPSRRMDSGEAEDLGDKTAANKCLAARRCFLQPYTPTAEDKKNGYGCCPGQTPHHLIEASALHKKGRSGKPIDPGIHDYEEGAAPCVCAEGCTQNVGTHGLMHTMQSDFASGCAGGTTTYKEARANSAACVSKVFPESACSEKCLEAQLDAYHRKCGLKDGTEIKAVETGQQGSQAVSDANDEIKRRTAEVKRRRARAGGGGH